MESLPLLITTKSNGQRTSTIVPPSTPTIILEFEVRFKRLKDFKRHSKALSTQIRSSLSQHFHHLSIENISKHIEIIPRVRHERSFSLDSPLNPIQIDKPLPALPALFTDSLEFVHMSSRYSSPQSAISSWAPPEEWIRSPLSDVNDESDSISPLLRRKDIIPSISCHSVQLMPTIEELAASLPNSQAISPVDSCPQSEPMLDEQNAWSTPSGSPETRDGWSPITPITPFSQREPSLLFPDELYTTEPEEESTIIDPLSPKYLSLIYDLLNEGSSPVQPDDVSSIYSDRTAIGFDRKYSRDGTMERESEVLSQSSYQELVDAYRLLAEPTMASLDGTDTAEDIRLVPQPLFWKKPNRLPYSIQRFHTSPHMGKHARSPVDCEADPSLFHKRLTATSQLSSTSLSISKPINLQEEAFVDFIKFSPTSVELTDPAYMLAPKSPIVEPPSPVPEYTEVKQHARKRSSLSNLLDATSPSRPWRHTRSALFGASSTLFKRSSKEHKDLDVAHEGQNSAGASPVFESRFSVETIDDGVDRHNSFLDKFRRQKKNSTGLRDTIKHVAVLDPNKIWYDTRPQENPGWI